MIQCKFCELENKKQYEDQLLKGTLTRKELMKTTGVSLEEINVHIDEHLEKVTKRKRLHLTRKSKLC